MLFKKLYIPIRSKTKESVNKRFIIYLLITIISACFIEVLGHQFVWDDIYALVKNEKYRGFSYSNISWMLKTFYDGNYHPLSWISFSIDYVLWQMNPAGYHATNLILHNINAVLFFFLIIQFIKINRKKHRFDYEKEILFFCAATGSLFFAIHPLRVENVAWLSTRGDLLCATFYILSISSYLKYTLSQIPGVKRNWYFLSIFFFILSLLSRAWGITIPVVLIILDVYPLNRIVRPYKQSGPHISLFLIEKIPFILFSVAAGVLSFLAKLKWAGIPDLIQHSIFDRFAQSAYGLCFYIWKTIVPTGLYPLYRLENNFNPFELKYILSIFTIVAIIAVLIITRKRSKCIIVGLGCFAVIVSPLLGIVQAGPQIAADRYTYISTLPFGIMIGGGLFQLWIKLQKKRRIFLKILTLIVIVSLLTVFFCLSFKQTRIWRDSFSLWTYVISRDPQNEIAYWNRGVYFENHKYFAAAMYDYSHVIRINPNSSKAYNSRGVMKSHLGDFAGALDDFNTAIKLNTNYIKAYANKGVVYVKQKKWKKAIENYSKALEISPNDIEYKKILEALKNKKDDID